MKKWHLVLICLVSAIEKEEVVVLGEEFDGAGVTEKKCFKLTLLIHFGVSCEIGIG